MGQVGGEVVKVGGGTQMRGCPRVSGAGSGVQVGVESGLG